MFFLFVALPCCLCTGWMVIGGQMASDFESDWEFDDEDLDFDWDDEDLDFDWDDDDW